MTRYEFFQKLRDMYPAKYPSPGAIEEYDKQLNIWKVSEKKLNELFKIVTEKCAWFPTMAVFLDCAEQAGIKVKRQPQDVWWQAFDINGKRYYRKGYMPGDMFPKQAEHGRYIVPPAQQYVDPYKPPKEQKDLTKNIGIL